MSAQIAVQTTFDFRYNHRLCPWCGAETRDYWVQIDWNWGAYEHPDDCPNCEWYATLSAVEYIENPDAVHVFDSSDDLPF